MNITCSGDGKLNRDTNTGGLLSEAHATNKAFSEITISLAKCVSDLQGLCLISLPEGGKGYKNRDSDETRKSELLSTLKSIARQVTVAEERITEYEKIISKECDAANQAVMAVRRLKHVDNLATKVVKGLVDNGKLEATSLVSNVEHESILDDNNDEIEGILPIDDERLDKDEEISVKPEKKGYSKTVREYITFLPQDKLDQVPRYMRGRLTFERFERACSMVQQAFVEKYTKLAIPRAKQSVQAREKILLWCEQETEELKDTPFVTIDDIISQRNSSDSSHFQKDIDMSCIKCTMQVLRFHNKVSMLTSGGFVRYCIPKM